MARSRLSVAIVDGWDAEFDNARMQITAESTPPAPRPWLYLAVILDLFTRKVVGWAMRDHMRAELTLPLLPWRSSAGAREPPSSITRIVTQGGFKRSSHHP